MMQSSSKTRCGYITIIGRPNVGKSTLLNEILGKKLSITSRKPQTTRHRLLGIKTQHNTQAIYIDTPGIHQKNHSELNRYMNQVAQHATIDVDLILFMVDGLNWKADDALALKKIQGADCPILLVVNKTDKIKEKYVLLPHLKSLNEKYDFKETFLISAKTGQGIDELEKTAQNYLPFEQYFFPDDTVTDRNDHFITTEIIREQLMRHLGDELPYSLTVGIEQFKMDKKILKVHAVIYVEKAGQKAIVIGKKGNLLKKTGTKTRMQLENYFDQKVFLQLWVKIKQNWSDNTTLLRSFGYD